MFSQPRQFLILNWFFAILISFTLVGCGSGGSDDDESSNQSKTIALSSAPILTIDSSYDTYGQTRAVLKDGDVLYVADGTVGLVVLQVTKFNSFIKITTLNFGGNGHAYSLAKSGDYLYMASRELGVHIIDVSDPSTPILYSTIAPQDLPGKASFLIVDQNLLFLSSGSYLVIFDISTPETPYEVARIQGSSIHQHLIVENNLVYIAQYDRGLQIVDVSNPSLPTSLSETRINYSARGIAKKDNYIYIGGGGSGVVVLDVSDPNNPSLIRSVSLPIENRQPSPQASFNMIVWGNFLFVADGYNGVHVVDITTPSYPVLVDTVDTSGSCLDLLVDGIKLYVADEFSGVHLLNIFKTTDIDGDGVVDGEDIFPNDPSEWADTDGDSIGNNTDSDDDGDGVQDTGDAFPTDASEWTDTDGDGVGDNADVFVYDPTEWDDSDFDGIGNNTDTISDPTLSFVSSNDSFGQARGTLKDGNIIYVANGTSGLQVLQIATDGSLTEIGTYPLNNGGRARYLAKINQYLYMASRSEGLLVLDVSNPSSPQYVYSYDTPDMATFLTIDGNILYLSDRNNLQIFDVSIPQSPVWLAELAAYSEFEHVIVSDGIAYIAGYYHGLFIVDVSDPANPTIMANTGGIGHGLWAVEKHDNYIFIGGEGSGLMVYDVTDPYNPSLLASLDLPSSADPSSSQDQPPFHMKVQGSYLFVADGDHGIQIVNISDPLSPFIESDVATPGYTLDFSVDGYTMIIGDYNNGVRMVNLGSNLDHDGDGVPNYLDELPLVP